MVRILIVDDDPGIRTLLRDAFALGGFEVGIAENGIEGLFEQATIPADLILTDIEMPGLDGVGMIRTLRASGDSVPVLVLSGAPNLGEILSEAGLDNQACLPKPCSIVDIIAHVDRMLNQPA